MATYNIKKLGFGGDRYVIYAANGLPTVSASDNGKTVQVTNGVWTLVSGSSLPVVTAADDGKVLRVVGGAWAAASLPSANGVSF